MGGCSGVLGLGRKHPLRIAFNWTKKAALSQMQFVADWPVCDLLSGEVREDLRGILSGEIHS